jgi:hypothetical protein
MKYQVTLALLVVSATFVWAQAPTSEGCGKNVSFAVAEQGQPVPAIPKFTLKWLGSKSRTEHFSQLCFSQVPSGSLTNYVVVFSTNASSFEGLKAAAHTYRTAAHDGSGVSSYGGTWSYSYSAAAPPVTSTLELKRDDKPKAVAVRAYDQSGRMVSQADLGAFSSGEKLLEKVFTDILRDSVPAESRKAFPAQSPVYYVNCDVDGQPVSPSAGSLALASASMKAPEPAAPAVAPPPPPELDIWSSPAGADVFLDGEYVGKTPYTASVSAGEHTVDLRKKDFAIWQRKIHVNPGKRRIGGNLEQKVLNLQ